MTKDPQLIIFDMDGLMIDSETLALNAWHQTAQELNMHIPEEVFFSMIGLNMDACKARMLEHTGPTFDFDSAITMLHGFMENHIIEHGLPLKPGLHYILDKLEEIGIKKSVATGTYYERAMVKLAQADVAHRFDVVIGGDQVAHSKPAPDIFLKAAKSCGIAPEYCIVLEDSIPGAEAARRAGMRVIVIPDLIPPLEKTHEFALAICKDLYEACGIIEKIFDSQKIS